MLIWRDSYNVLFLLKWSLWKPLLQVIVNASVALIRHSLVYDYVASADYNGTSEIIQFEDGGQQCVNIPITMDMVLEGEEQFVAVLRSQDSAVKLAQSTALVTLLDADCTNSMLTVSIHIYTCILV